MQLTTRLTVIKIGGSLFDEPCLFDRVSRLCAAFEADRILIVPGGGAAADVVRAWDSLFEIGEVASHFLAIQAMGLGARLLAHGVANSELAASIDDCHDAWGANRIAIVDPQPIIGELTTPDAPPLKQSWDVTADSIAAWIALRLDASRLVFCKSISLPEARAKPDSVDAYLSTMSELPDLFWCNMRDEIVSVLPFELPFNQSNLP